MLSTHNDRFIAPFKRDSAAEERAIEPDDSSSRSIFGDSATASNSGCNSRESIAPVSDSLHPQRQTQRTKLEHLGFLITLSTNVFCLQILVPPSPEYVSPICDLHTGAAIEAVAFDLQMAGSSAIPRASAYRNPLSVPDSGPAQAC